MSRNEPNAEHLEVLEQGADAWNAWREEHPDARPDFRKADLRGADLAGSDLHRAHLGRADLREADLTGANLRGANLRDARLDDAVLDQVDLSWVVFLKQRQLEATRSSAGTLFPGYLHNPHRTASAADAGVELPDGAIDVNIAPPEVLTEINHITDERAREIIRLRPFTELEELKDVRGLGPKRVADIIDEGVAWIAPQMHLDDEDEDEDDES